MGAVSAGPPHDRGGARTRRGAGPIAALALATILTVTGMAGAETCSGHDTTRLETLMPAAFSDAGICVLPLSNEAKRCRLRGALTEGFGVQYWGDDFTAEELERADHGLLIVEATRLGAAESPDGRERFFGREEVRQMSRNGRRPVLAYLDLTEIEFYRDYWVRHVERLSSPDAAFEAPWIGPRTADDELLALYWTPEWNRILQERVARLMALGFDGIMFDDALHYYSFQSGEGLRWNGAAAEPPKGGHAMALMTLMLRLTRAMRADNPSAIAVVNNGVFVARDAAAAAGCRRADPVFDRYAAALDGVLVESLFAPGAGQDARDAVHEDFGARGVSVLTIDYLSAFPRLPDRVMRAMLSWRAAGFGFCPYVVADGAFDRLSPPLRCQVAR